jgi:hypothetical protein
MPDNDALNKLFESFGRIDGKMDGLFAALQSHVARQDDNHKDHDARITALEQLQWKMMGAAAAIAAVIGPGASALIGAIFRGQ